MGNMKVTRPITAVNELHSLTTKQLRELADLVEDQVYTAALRFGTLSDEAAQLEREWWRVLEELAYRQRRIS